MKDEVLYKKNKDGLFFPVGVMLANYLPDGLWWIHSKDITSYSYITNLFSTDWIEKLTPRQICNLYSFSEEILYEFYSTHHDQYSLQELILFILEKVYDTK